MLRSYTTSLRTKLHTLTIALSVLLFFSCSRSDEPINAQGMQHQIPDGEWNRFLNSGEGLWANSPEHTISFTAMVNLTDPESMTPVIYKAGSVCSVGDTLYVTDSATKKVVAIDLQGNLLWEAGGEGEGPGEFPSIITIAASGSCIAVPNHMLSRIEFFERDGTFIRSIIFPEVQDITAINDTTFIVASDEEPGGHLHMITASGEKLRSFGAAPMDTYENIPRIDLMRICFNGEDRVAVFNRYEATLAIFDINTEEIIFQGSRPYPDTPTLPSTLEDGRRIHFPVGGNAFTGPEGMINVMLSNVMNDGTFISDPEYLDFAPVTIVDRYDWNGTYLDTYSLPDSCVNWATTLQDGNLVIKNYAEGALKLLELD